MDAKKILGYNGRLTIKQRMHVNTVQQALDHGATFRRKEDAQQFARRELTMKMMLVLVFALTAALYLYIGHASGWFDGFKTGLKVCELITGAA